MGRIDYLPRTGMYDQAFYHIMEIDPSFPYEEEDLERIKNTRVYDASTGTTSKEYQELCKDINTWLREHYDMFELDYTDFNDYGSRSECVLCYTKSNDPVYNRPDFVNELPKVVFYR